MYLSHPTPYARGLAGRIERERVRTVLRLAGVRPGDAVLEVGCESGTLLAAVPPCRRLVGIDISARALADARVRFERASRSVELYQVDAERGLPFARGEFDVVICLCQGAFGLGLPDLQILRNIRKSMKPGGRLALGAANVFYALNHLEGLGGPVTGEFDPVKMLFKARVEGVIGAGGETADFEIWNSCYTPRELEWIANGAGLNPEAVFGVSPGEYGREVPTFEHPELLLIARKP